MSHGLACDFHRFAIFDVDLVHCSGKFASKYLLIALVAMNKNRPQDHRLASATSIDPGLLTLLLQHVYNVFL